MGYSQALGVRHQLQQLGASATLIEVVSSIKKSLFSVLSCNSAEDSVHYLRAQVGTSALFQR